MMPSDSRRTLLRTTAIAVLGGIVTATNAHAGEIVGVVTDTAGNTPVAGAIVSIPGTTFSTTTDASGAYKLDGVPAGRYSVEAVAAGYDIGAASRSVPAAGPVTLDFSAYPGNTEIVIIGNRFSARREQFESPAAISVLSAADLSHTAVHNAAEVLGLLPSVNVMRTGNSFMGGIDGAARGEGQYVSIRSLNAEYNVNLINGIEVAQAQPYSRGVGLNLLPPNGLQTVVLDKTSTADMDGDAIGGTIDFRTPTAFDFNGVQNGSFSTSGNFEGQADRLGSDSKGYGAAADFSRKFGADQSFGIYVSGYYNIRHYANSMFGGMMEAGGGDRAYALSYVDANGNIPAGMNPINDLILGGFNVGVAPGQTELWGGTLSLDWRPDADTSYYLHATYAHDVTAQNTIVNQIVGEGMIRNEGTVPDLDTGLYIPAGDGLYQTVIPNVSNRLWYETNPLLAKLATVEIGTRQTFGNFHMEPSLFYSFGRNDRPDHFELWTTSIPTGSSSSGASPFGGATLVTYDDNNFPVAHLTPGMDFAARNPGTMPAPCCYELTAGFSEQTKYGARFDAGFDHEGGLLRAIDFGVKYVHSDRDVTNHDWTVGEPSPADSFADDQSILSGYFPGFPGHYPYPIPNVNHNELKRRFAALTSAPGALDAASDICTSGSTAIGVITNNNCNTLSGTEAVSSVYALGRFGSDILGFNVGIRYESTDVDNDYWVRVSDASGSEVMGHWGSNSSSFSKVLPSAFLTYRPSDSVVYRAGVWTSYTRPPFFQLAGNSTSNFDTSTGTTTVRMGNPDLKSIEAVNFDLSGNWRTDDGGFYGLGVFYKQLSNYIYDSGTGYVNAVTVSSGLTETIQPRNGGDGDVWGIELEGQQKFSAMPAPFNKLSIGGNVTIQRSKVDIGTSWGDSQRIQNAPEVTANLGVYYNDGALSLDVLYHYAGEYVSAYDVLGKGGDWDNLWVAPVRSLDLHAGYNFGLVQFDLSVANLLDDYTYWSHVGENSVAISDVIQSGRTVVASLRYTF